MDWIYVGLNGDLSEHKNDSFIELRQKAKEWHDSLEIGDGDINYVEENPILIDFRDADGYGFYWADLETNDSREECERMGHCGRTGYGNTIVSLRENKKLNDKFSLNKSHLTAAIDFNNGILYQLKGTKNSKPKDIYHEYIIPLFELTNDDDEWVIKSLGSEYARDLDFKVQDLPKESLLMLYEIRPDLFNTLSLKYKLGELGIIEPIEIPTTFMLDLSPAEVSDYIEDISYRVKAKNGTTRTINYSEKILNGETWDLWDNYNADWKSAIQYNTNKENDAKIENILKEICTKNDIEFDEDLSLEEQIKEYDIDHEVRSAIASAVNDAKADDYVNYLTSSLESCLEELGTVSQMNYNGVRIQIDLGDYFSKEKILSFMEEYNTENLKELFDELIYNGEIEQPKFTLDERWYPSIDDENFNSILSDRLLEIQP
jgi:hypothetical protein